MSGVSQGVSQNFTKSSPDSPVHVQLNDSSFTAGSLVITSTTPINNGVTETFGPEQNDYAEALLTCYTDQRGLLYVEFSDDGANFYSSSAYRVEANLYFSYRLVKASRYMRVRFTNDSGVNQSLFQLHVYHGDIDPLTVNINQAVGSQTGAIMTRSVDPQLDLSLARIGGFSDINKFGARPELPAGASVTARQDVWALGGAYSGFPTGAPETLTFLCDPMDVGGSVEFTGLKSATSTAFETETILLTGASTTTASTWYRVISAKFRGTSSLVANMFDITCRHTTTTTNVFFVIRANFGQTTISGVTIPFGSRGVLKTIDASVTPGNSATIKGAIWVREYLKSPAFTELFGVSDNAPHLRHYYGGIVYPPLTDLIVTAIGSDSTGGNPDFFAAMDIIFAKDPLI